MRNAVKYLAIAIGAFFGGALRILIEALAPASTGSAIGVLIANTLACLVIGLATGWFLKKVTNDFLNKVLVTGFCGSLSTFSSFSSGLYLMINEGKFLEVLAFTCFNLVFTFIGLSVGLYLCLGNKIIGELL